MASSIIATPTTLDRRRRLRKPYDEQLYCRQHFADGRVSGVCVALPVLLLVVVAVAAARVISDDACRLSAGGACLLGRACTLVGCCRTVHTYRAFDSSVVDSSGNGRTGEIRDILAGGRRLLRHTRERTGGKGWSTRRFSIERLPPPSPRRCLMLVHGGDDERQTSSACLGGFCRCRRRGVPFSASLLVAPANPQNGRSESRCCSSPARAWL